MQIHYEKIEYEGKTINNFFGKIPVLYYNGRIITNKQLFHFLNDLVERNEENNIDIDLSNKKLLGEIIHVLKDQLLFADEYYYYLYNVEKLHKEKFKSGLGIYKYLSYVNNGEETITVEILNNFTIESIRLNADYTIIPYQYLDPQNKAIELIKDAFSKIQVLTEKLTDKDNYIKLVIYSLLLQDSLLFHEIQRPFLNDHKQYTKAENYKKSLSRLFLSSSLKLFSCLKIDIIIDDLFQKYNIAFNPNKKKIFLPIEEIQARNSFYHNLFAIGVFGSMCLLFYYLSTRKPINKTTNTKKFMDVYYRQLIENMNPIYDNNYDYELN